MQKEPELDVTVYAVWFAMVDTDERERWQPGLLDDPRVRHYWDEGKVAGRWFAAHGETLDVEFEGERLWNRLCLSPRGSMERAPGPDDRVGPTRHPREKGAAASGPGGGEGAGSVIAAARR